MSSLVRRRGKLWAWGAFTALLLGGCALDATGVEDPQESYGFGTEELAAAEGEDRTPNPREEAILSDDAPLPEDESGNDLGPVVVTFAADGTPNDPHPDPWHAMGTVSNTGNNDL